MGEVGGWRKESEFIEGMRRGGEEREIRKVSDESREGRGEWRNLYLGDCEGIQWWLVKKRKVRWER